MMRYNYFVFSLLVLATVVECQDQNNVTTPSPDGTGRNKKELSVFQVVRFPNIGCSSGSSYNGTCYTASECSNKGGTNSGSCASGFGVCCTFLLGCGSTIAENCSYFVSSTSQPAGTCSVQICECSTDICQLRLDFNNFVITGPSTITYTQVLSINGAVVPVATIPTPAPLAVSSSFATRCLTDTFSVTGNAASSPVICGTNTGYHMYVDSSSSCNTLSFQMNPSASLGVTVATRSWNIKISQISCFSPWLAPSGCTQYFTGTSGMINSYNYAAATPQQLANQQQQICFRRERGYCKLCLTQAAQSSTDFQISNNIAVIGVTGQSCCGYGIGIVQAGYDCLVVPGASPPAALTPVLNNNFCGTAFGTAIGSTVCTAQQPFNIQFLTDSLTNTPAAPATFKTGFKLTWFLTTC